MNGTSVFYKSHLHSWYQWDGEDPQWRDGCLSIREQVPARCCLWHYVHFNLCWNIGLYFWTWTCALNQTMPSYSSLWDRKVISKSVQWFDSSLLWDLATPCSLVTYTIVNEIPWWKTFWYHQKVLNVRPFSSGNLVWGFSGPAHGVWHRDEGCCLKRLPIRPTLISLTTLL